LGTIGCHGWKNLHQEAGSIEYSKHAEEVCASDATALFEDWEKCGPTWNKVSEGKIVFCGSNSCLLKPC